MLNYLFIQTIIWIFHLDMLRKLISTLMLFRSILNNVSIAFFHSASKTGVFSNHLICVSLLISGSCIYPMLGIKVLIVSDENKKFLFAQHTYMNYSDLCARPLRVLRFQSWMLDAVAYLCYPSPWR